MDNCGAILESLESRVAQYLSILDMNLEGQLRVSTGSIFDLTELLKTSLHSMICNGEDV